LLHTIILIAELILGFFSLGLRIDPSNWTSVESNIFPYRILCLINIGYLGQENLEIFQCTLLYQYTIVHMVIMIFFNIIYLVRCLYIYKNKTSRRREWIRYFDSQISTRFDMAQARHVVEYMSIDGYYVFTILQKNLIFEDFQKFFELFIGITLEEVHEQINIEN
jgi:hypothetical protein